ncbi:MAG: hypothetical protein HY026_10065 [Deltaproteobacteria bacterium]|nr:hypothetical protein [Deltaproteobacteria bacterium]
MIVKFLFRRVLTEKRLEMLYVIKEKRKRVSSDILFSSAGSILQIEPEFYGLGYKPEPANMGLETLTEPFELGGMASEINLKHPSQI